MGSRSCAVLAAWVGVALALSSCGSGAQSPSVTPTTHVRLLQNPWDASRLDAAIAKQLLTSQMGMTVEVTETDESSMWAQLASGNQDACLEVWPSGHAADIRNYIANGTVENAGTLGPVGKISWYVPTYLLIGNPQLGAWQAYLDPSNTAAFATPDTGTRGRLLSGDRSWTSYDQEIIQNLGLNLEVVYAGSEDAEIEELANVYSKRGAILIYLWTPHAALEKYDLTPISLPPYTADCYAKAPAHGIACDYPTDQLFKIVWPGLALANPRAYRFLKSFSYSTADQIALLNLVDNNRTTIDDAAAQWIASHPSAWAAWVK
jgi:glycine betaine/proline transport system substrate-binding protein